MTPGTVEADEARPLVFALGAKVKPVHVLAAMIGVFLYTFGRLAYRQTSNFGTFGFDMGIYDQGIWLATHFKHPFMTVRGLNFYGHHFNPIVFLFAPAYWLGAGPHFLVLVQAAFLAAGAAPIWLLARDKVDEWAALVPAAAYLLFPATEWLNWWHFHPDALIITPLLFAWWLYTRKQWRWFFVALLVALACKEDSAVAVTVLGVVMFVRGERKWAIRTFVLGVGWFLMCTKLIIPFANGGGSPFYQEFFPGLGNSLPEIAFNMVRHPSRVYHPMWMGDRRHYYWQLLAPVAGLPLAAPLLLVVGLPQIIVNSVSDHPTHDIRFHYSAIPIAVLFIATTEVYCRIVRRGENARVAMVSLLLVSSIMTNHLWSPSPAGRLYHSGIWATSNPRHKIYKEAIKLVQPGDKVSATYYLVPHLTHRSYIYEWPNPFHAANWGIGDKNPPKPDDANLLVLDTNINGPEPAALLAELTGPKGWFRVIYDNEGVIVARRIRPGPAGQMPLPQAPPPTTTTTMPSPLSSP